MPRKSPSRILDKKFVTAAVLIGGFYALTIVVLGQVFGKEAAGVAGVALTALLMAIFQKFERLRFRQLREHEHIDVPSPEIRWTQLVVWATYFFGLQLILSLIAAPFLSPLLPRVSGNAVQWLSNWQVQAVSVSYAALVYCLGGFLISKAVRLKSYSPLLVASFLSNLLTWMLVILFFTKLNIVSVEYYLTSTRLWVTTASSLLYVATTLFGAWLGQQEIFALPHHRRSHRVKSRKVR